jgi:lysozyme
MTLAGIDVSAAGQGANFPWASYKGKIAFAGIKISEGTTFADPDAARNIAGARSIGAIPLGYHFTHAGMSGAQQAEWFLKCGKVAGLRAGDLAAQDAEDEGMDGLPVARMDLAAAAFNLEFRLHHACWPLLYTEVSLAPSMTSCGNSPLWLANPSGTPVTSIGPWAAGPSFEQTSQRGVDLDVFYGTPAQLAKLIIP